MEREKRNGLRAGAVFAGAMAGAVLIFAVTLYANSVLRSRGALSDAQTTMLYRLTDWLHVGTIAVYLTAILYTLSLYRGKPSEKYLLHFGTYAAMMLAWALLIKMDRTSAAVFWAECVLYIFVGVFSMKMCFGLTKPSLPRALAWVGRPVFYPVSIVWVGAYIASYELGIKPLVAAVLLVPYAVCLYILSCAVTQKRRMAFVLLAAMTLVTGLRPSVMPDTLFVVYGPESEFMRILRENMRVYELFFVLAAMLYVNREFAWQFSEKERLAAHLDELVQERTQKLIDVQQQRQSMMLNIFHDVRTPLAVMRGALDTIGAHPESSERMLELIDSRLSFVTELTSELFLAAKLEDKQVLLTCSRIDLSEVIAEQGEQAKRLAAEADVSLTTQVKPGLFVWGERMRLAQIAQNLLTNAFHYTPAGGRVELTLAREGGEAVLRVRDSGKGISKEDQAHIFDRYFHTTAQNKHESSGLGLTIARELTALHRGTLDVESAPGAGTTFIAHFALLEEEKGNEHAGNMA